MQIAGPRVRKAQNPGRNRALQNAISCGRSVESLLNLSAKWGVQMAGMNFQTRSSPCALQSSPACPLRVPFTAPPSISLRLFQTVSA
ncbi:DUF6783 domain-containing protein [Enterocloster asparagiformis]|uniref:DUF6783 domain-containing protein n=1 Tax=Enterocloster asparagiformis TaxID=333367 RepID=UPI0036F2722D